MPQKKTYIVLCGDDYIVVPIKAKWSPHITDAKVESFLWGEPNFFGGEVKDRETVWDALQREVTEESAETRELIGYEIALFDEGSYRTKRGQNVPCEFYYSRQWVKTGNWPSEEYWKTLRREGADYNEMCFVVNVSREAFLNRLPPDGRGTANDYWFVIMNEARQQAPDWARKQFRDGPSVRDGRNPGFAETETGRALEKFILEWLTDKLPPPPDLRRAVKRSASDRSSHHLPRQHGRPRELRTTTDRGAIESKLIVR